MKKSVFECLRFDEADDQFELLETEDGAPGFFNRWPKDEAPQTKPIEAPPSESVDENEKRLKKDFRSEINPDVLLRRFLIGGAIPALAACLNGMASRSEINDFILRQSMFKGVMQGVEKDRAKYAMEHVFAQQEAELEDDWDKIKAAVCEGRTAVFLEGDSKAVLMDTRSYEQREVGTAQNEKVIRGPQEGFVENLRTNVSLLRRIIKTDDFICEFKDAGATNNVMLVIAYRDGVVNRKLLLEVKRRLNSINTRMILSDGTIEQLTERSSLSPLPQVLSTERPDRVAAHIMQGHVAVICDGSPTASVMPATLFTLMSTSEDAYVRRPLGTILRVVRYIGAGVSILLPGYFISLALHHQGMLSTEVISTVIASRRMVYLPIGLEMIFLLWVFQLLREAGLRVPGSIGQAMGIIGGLVLGQAAVAANMVSTVVLIFVALSGMGTFTIPDHSTQVAAEYFRLFLVIAGWLGGLLGFSAGMLALGVWLVSLKSYGLPFLSPIAPRTYSKQPAILRGKVTQHSRATDYTNPEEGLS